jgi:glycosyltransferase involved in cell wall biosynthesis
MNRNRFAPEICCLKEPGPIGELLAHELPVVSRFLSTKWDVRVFHRLCRLMRRRRYAAVITVGAGDKMFWGRLSAWWSGVPVICSAIHSTGWPDCIGFLNRRLTFLTDAFIAVATPHARHLVNQEKFPAGKVCVIPNGIDTKRFQPRADAGPALRRTLKIPATASVVGIVAALRPEKNLALFVNSAAKVLLRHPAAHFLVVGDGPERPGLEQLARSLNIAGSIHFLGTRTDIPDVLAALDVFVLTSHNEANPVSILEALACEIPVIATRVGSVPETVIPGQTGFLVTPGSVDEVTDRLDQLIAEPELRQRLGKSGRMLVESNGSLERMVQGYEELLTKLYQARRGAV